MMHRQQAPRAEAQRRTTAAETIVGRTDSGAADRRREERVRCGERTKSVGSTPGLPPLPRCPNEQRAIARLCGYAEATPKSKNKAPIEKGGQSELPLAKEESDRYKEKIAEVARRKENLRSRVSRKETA